MIFPSAREPDALPVAPFPPRGHQARGSTLRFAACASSCLVLLAGCAGTTPSANTAKAATDDQKAQTVRSLEGMTRVPLVVTGQGSALVRCSINGKPITLILDTGAQGTVIDLRAATAAGVKSKEVPGFYSRGIGAGRVAMRQGETITLEMSGFPARVSPTLQDFSGLTLQHLQTGSTPIVGLLGFDVLRSYGAIIDLQEGAMYLRKR
jgi:hypothetical protein